MSGQIRYRLNWEKAFEAIVWLANRQPGIGFFHISKVLFYADKMHLQRYGRPITGDVYIAMTYGPVPSGVYDLLKHEPFLPPEILEKLDESLEIDRPRVRAKRPVREDQFSGSDLRILEEAYQRYSHVPFGDLSDLSHRERAYIEANPNSVMDMELLVDDDLPDREILIAEIREKAAYGVL